MARDYRALAGFIAGRETMPFAFGRRANDCVAYCAGAVAAQTGKDPLKGLRWSTEAGAARLLRRFGGLAEAVSSRLTEIPPALAHRGDVAGVADEAAPGGIRLMIVEGELLVGPGDAGNVRMRRSAMIRAWSAG